MSEYFSKPKSLWANVKVKLDLSKYETKPDLKNAADADTPDFTKKTDLTDSKYDVNKLDIDKSSLKSKFKK